MPAVRPLIILDVDGTVSPLGDKSPWKDAENLPGSVYDILVSREMGRRLEALPGRRVWLSDWGWKANASVAPCLGWEQPIPAFSRPLRNRDAWDVDQDHWWKLAAARDLVEEFRVPFVWADDHLKDNPEVKRWAQRSGLPHLLLRPDSRVGLTPSDLTRMEAFCRRFDHSMELSSGSNNPGPTLV